LCQSADVEARDPEVKQERSEGEDPRHRRDIEIGTPPVATENRTATPQPRTCRSITEVSRTQNTVFKSETDTETLTQRLLHKGSDQISDPGPAENIPLGPHRSRKTIPLYNMNHVSIHRFCASKVIQRKKIMAAVMETGSFGTIF
jgi:hypothetical protein